MGAERPAPTVGVFYYFCVYMCTVLPRTEARAFNKLNEKRMLKALRMDAHVLLFENVRLLLNAT